VADEEAWNGEAPPTSACVLYGRGPGSPPGASRGRVNPGPGSATKIQDLGVRQTGIRGSGCDGDASCGRCSWYKTGGTGTFYYVAAALHVNGLYRAPNAILLVRPGSAAEMSPFGTAWSLPNYATAARKSPMSSALCRQVEISYPQ